jgi:cobalt-zinc-cadmium efflux system membrane fusion protein
MERKWILGGAVLLALSVAGGAMLWPDETAPVEQAATDAKPGTLSPEQIRRMGVMVEAAVPASSAELGTVPGTVTLPPEARVAVTAPFGGSVVRLFVLNGQAVTKGQPLAIVRSIEPVQYGAALARGQAQLAVAQAHAARTGQLAREGIVAGARADEAQAALREAQVAVAENRRILAQTGAGASGEMTLRAPITGRLAVVNVQTGGPVDGLTAPFVVENTASFMLDLQIPQRLAGAVNPGMALTLPGSAGQAIRGSIISVGSSIDPATRSVIAKARIGGDPMLVSGQSVMATLKGSTALSGVSVPSAAVTQMAGKDVVFVAVRTGFAARPVTVAGRSADRVTLASGLKAGEQVATSGLAELKVLLGGE